MIGRILLTLAALAFSGFVFLVLIGLWGRYEQETEAPQAGFFSAQHARAAAAAEREVGQMQLAPQQGQKLVGTGAVGSTNQGMSVALSADGNTAIMGGPGPNNADRDRSPFVGPVGAAWVFTRSGGIWTQQGNKLVGTTKEYGGGLWSQGASVALSADGNAAIVGGWRAEAAWVFTRSGGVWTQQGKKLVGAGAVGGARQGMSVALSADGNTAIVGGWSDNSKTGAAWVFTRQGGVWIQQGNKLVGVGAVGGARQGMSVALSADGNTAIVGGPGDNPWDQSVPFGLGAAGAAWVFTRSGGVWTQQGNKLVGVGAVGSARQGMSVALSADGNTAVVGGWSDNSRVGTAWVFGRSGGVWTQQGNKLIEGSAAPSVALSADGSIVMVGGSNYNWGAGAAWVFTRSEGRLDYQGPPTPSTSRND